jgi:hypothetical protein
VLALGSASPEPDPDLWGHLRYGLDLLRTGRLEWSDPYSYTAAGAAWGHHEWLGEAAMAAAWGAGGPAGLRWLRLGAAAGILAAASHCIRSGPARAFPALSALVFAVSWVALAPGLAYRPQLATYLLFALLLAFADAAGRGRLPARSAALALPPGFALWANLHGGWVAGLAVLWLWAAAQWGEAALGDAAARGRAGWATAAAALSSAATALNPRGTGLWLQLWDDLSVPRGATIGEWLPVPFPSAGQPAFQGLVLASAAALAWLAASRGPAGLRGGVFAAAVLAATGAMGYRHVRHCPFLAIAAASFLPGLLAAARRGDAAPGGRPAARAAAGEAAAFLGIGLACTAVLSAAGAIPADLPVPPGYPVGALRLLRESGVRGNLAVHFDWAQMAVWHLGGDRAAGREPQCRVAYDGRHRQVYPLAVERAWFAFEGLDAGPGTPPWDAVLERWPTDLVLMPPSWPHAGEMRRRPGWSLAYEGEALLFVRAAAAPAAQESPGRAGAGGGRDVGPPFPGD